MSAPARPGPGSAWRFEEIALLIESAGQGRCKVRVATAPYGTGLQHAEFTYTPPELVALIAATEAAVRGSGPPVATGNRDLIGVGGTAPDRSDSPEKIGDRLFRALFAGEVLGAFQHSVGRVEDQPNTGLRIRIEIDPSLPDQLEISSLPWELIHRPGRGDYLARNILTPVVRYLAVPGLTAPAPLPAALRILAVSSQPPGTAALDVERELRNLAGAWEQEPRVEVEVLDHATLVELRARLRGGAFHVLHFIGHGDFEDTTGSGFLALENGRGGAVHVDGRTLGDTLRDSRSSLRLVVLNACATARLPRRNGQDPFSGVASALLLAGIPAVVAMQFPISDGAALAFSREFYGTLASGLPVDAAAAEGRMGIHLAHPESWEWATPALFMSVPDGRILVPSQAQPVTTKAEDPGAERRSFDSPRHRPRRLLPAVALVLGSVLLALIGAALRWYAPARSGPERIAAAAAIRHVHENAMVCGYVAGARYVESASGKPTFLDFEKPFPDEAFSVVIWGPERALFQEPPEVQFVRRKLCVTGNVEQYGEKPEIVVRAPAQLVLDRD